MKHDLRDRAVGGILFSVFTVCVTAIPVVAQSVPEIENAAKSAAEAVAKTHQQHIFIMGSLNCQLDMQLCAAFDVSLHGELEKMVPGAQFAEHDDIVGLLPKRGFIALDLSVTDVLMPAASEAGVEIVVTDSLTWQRDGYEFSYHIFDARRQKMLDQFKTKIKRAVPDVGGAPLVLKDKETGILQVISRGTPSRLMLNVWLPHCDKCPDPSYTPEARKNNLEGIVLILVTVTDQGTAEQVSVIKGLGDGLTDQAVQTVRGWHFKPVIGLDGKPAAMRVPVQIKFILHR